jgi:predicted NBD/HSP70 family sugar kinase
LRASRVGELVIGRTSVLLKKAGHAIDVVPIHHDPDEAGLMGAVHLAPRWMLTGHTGVLAVDIGGSNIRAGVVAFECKKAGGMPKCDVAEMKLWRHADESTPPTREGAVARIVDFLRSLARWAEKHDLRLAPFIGVACPGAIASDGHIERGSDNLPGNWGAGHFNLPNRLREALPRIGNHKTMVVMHNDAVVQGLSEMAYVEDVDEWAVLTIGTGLGNAKFTNRKRGAAGRPSR